MRLSRRNFRRRVILISIKIIRRILKANHKRENYGGRDESYYAVRIRYTIYVSFSHQKYI